MYSIPLSVWTTIVPFSDRLSFHIQTVILMQESSLQRCLNYFSCGMCIHCQSTTFCVAACCLVCTNHRIFCFSAKARASTSVCANNPSLFGLMICSGCIWISPCDNNLFQDANATWRKFSL